MLTEELTLSYPVTAQTEPRVMSGVSHQFPPGKCLQQTRVLFLMSSSLILKTDNQVALHVGSSDIP